MDNLKDFRKSAIMLVYPNGCIQNVLVDERLIHLKYFIGLYKEDMYFRDIVDTYKIPVPDSLFDYDMPTSFDIDRELAKIGIIVFHNLFIDAVQHNEKYILDAPPQFYVTLPNVLTDEQEKIINELFSTYDMSCSLYGRCIDDELDDIKYDEFISTLRSRRK